MSNEKKYIIFNFLLLIFVYISKHFLIETLATFIRISLIKIPYLIVGLLLFYYNFSYKSTLTKFDRIAKRKIPGMRKTLAEYFLLSYTALILITKIFLITEHFINPDKSIIGNQTLRTEFFGNDIAFSSILLADSICEGLILLFSICCLMFSKTEKIEKKEDTMDNGEEKKGLGIIETNKSLPFHFSNEEKFTIYSGYKRDKFEKKWFFFIQFLIMAIVISLNISLVNLSNLVVFLLMIFSAYFLSFKWLEITNIINIITGFFLLITHYVFNITEVKEKITVVGMADFNSVYSIIFYSVCSVSFLVSCIINKNNAGDDKIYVNRILFGDSGDSSAKKECKEFFRKNKNNLHYFYMKKVIKTLSKFSSICYKTVLFILILSHVCMLMLVNFLFLFFGITKDNKIFKKFTLIPTFAICCFFLVGQFVYNMSMAFVFENAKIYKYLEIIGFFKFYRSKLAKNRSNIYDLEISDESKFNGAIIDTVMILLLLLFTVGSNLYQREDERDIKRGTNDITVQIGNNQDKEELNILKEENLNLIQNEAAKQDINENDTKDIEKENLLTKDMSPIISDKNRNYTWKEILLEKSYIVSVVFIFICSTIKFDLIHVIYLVLFLLLVVVRNTYFKAVWDIILIVNTSIIIFLYFWNILAMNYINVEEEADPRNENIFSYLGLKIDQDSVFFFYYWEHITLYLFGYLQKFVINYFYMQKGVRVDTEQIYKLPEWSRLITFSILLLLVITLTVIKPCTFIGVIFLVYYLVFISMTMFIRSKNKNRIVRSLITVLIFFSVVSILIKYIFHFDFVVNYLKNLLINDQAKVEIKPDPSNPSDSHSSLEDSPNSYLYPLEDLELDGQNLTLKLFLAALLIIVSNVLLSYNAYNLKENIEEDDSNDKANKENDIENESSVLNLSNYFDSKNELRTMLVYFRIACYQIIYMHSTKIMIFVSVIISFKLDSIIGVIILGTILFTLLHELKSNWRNSYLPLLFISLISILFIYLCNLNSLKRWMSKDYEWLGFYYFDQKSDLLYSVIPFCAVIFLCFISRISPIFKEYFLSSKKYEIKITESGVVIEERQIEDFEGIQENIRIENSVLSRNINQTQMTILQCKKEEEEIIKSLSLIWIKAEWFWYLYGFYFVLVIIILISFIKVNILSLIFMIFVGFQSFGVYKRCEYRTEKEINNKKNFKIIRSAWIIFSILLSIITFLQYVNYMWFPPSWKVTKPWENLSFFCATEGKTTYSKNSFYKQKSDYDSCLLDWKAWLGIDNYGSTDMFFNFVCIFVLLLSYKYLTDKEIFNRSEFDPSKIIDFTISENRRSNPYASKNHFMFIYLKSFILYYIIIISIIYSYKYTNLIYGGFLFISFYLLFKDAALTKHKNNLWKYVQYYNYLVLVGFMLFQNPFLPCPVNRDGRNYIGLEECVEEENRLYQSYLLYDYPKDTIDALYMVMVQTIGVLKLNFQLLIVGNLSLFLIYIVAILQEIIYEHPYQILVDNYLLREKQINCKSRAFKIVQDIHFQTYCAYRQLFTHMDGLTDKLKRLSKKIKKYENLWKQSNFKYIHYSLTDEDKLNLTEQIDINKSEEEFEDKITMIIEELFSIDKKLPGLIDYKLVKDLILRVYRLHFNENYVQENLKNEDKEKEFKEFIIRNSIQDLKVLFATQFKKDRKILYNSNFYGLGIANSSFDKIAAEPHEDPLTITTEQKEMEMLKDIFLKSQLFKKHKIKEEKTEDIEGDLNNNQQNIHEEIDDIKLTESVYCSYIEKLSLAYGISPHQETEFSYYNYFRKQLWKSVDKVLLIDLTINSKKIKIANLFEMFLFAIYSNVEIFLVIAFIINHCMDASIMSMVYPISYFGYALLEYPFPNKTYWKVMIVYSLVIITIKLLYQFPFFCGYPFLAVFNIFKENYCEYYPLTDVEITSSFVFSLGLRKYTGEYSYPKNDGLLYGILGDIILLGLLLIMRSLLKWKGIWNFIDVRNEFIKVPRFTHKLLPIKNSSIDEKVNQSNEIKEAIEIRVEGDIDDIEEETQKQIMETRNQIEIHSNANNDDKKDTVQEKNNENILYDTSKSAETIPSRYFSSNSDYTANSLSSSKNNFFVLFLKRVVPELFVNQNSIMYKPGIDYYPLSFAAILVILIYTLFFFGSLTGKSSEGIQDALDKQQFSKDLVWTVLIIISITVIDRIIYKLRSINNEKFTSHYTDHETIAFNQSGVKVNDDISTSNIALTIKLIMHYLLLLGTHILLFFIIPITTRICFFNNNSLIILYAMCCIYFYFSAKQLKYGFPLITKGQYFADSTQLRNRIAFKIYRNVPFLYELRAILDWTITKTSLNLFQWFKMEDAYATLYDVKCDMDMRKKRKEGEDRWWLEKISWGLCSFVFLMFILILPMILFSGFNPNLVENKVLNGKFKINLELKDPESQTSTYFLNLFEIPNLKINNIKEQKHYDYLKSFLIANIDDLEKRKVQKVKVINYSQLDWILSPPAITALLKYLEKDTDCYVNIEWEFVREYPKNFKNMGGSKSVKLNTEQISSLRNIIFAIKGHQKPDKYSLQIDDAFPKVVRLSNNKYTYIKFDTKRKIPHKENTDIQLQLIKDNERDVYWKITQTNIQEMDDSPFFNKYNELCFILVNDDVISSFFGFNSDGGIPLSIIGIYATLVFSVGKFIRFFFDKASQRVIYEEMPNPKPLIELCEGVYIYRNHRMLKDEQMLYHLLIRIYRSPETLIEITGNHLAPK